MDYLGYDNYIVERKSSTCATAIFFKKNKFEILEKETLYFSDDKNYFLIWCKFAKKI
jgi:hypothetical protein